MAEPLRIRNASTSDLDQLVAMAESMHHESPRFRGFTFLPDRLRGVLDSLLDMDHGCLLVAEQGTELTGGLAAVAYPHFACDVLQACDLGLFMLPQHRGGTTAARLVRKYVEWARGIGAEPSIGINTGVDPDRTARLLATLGAQQTGTHWTWRDLSCA